MIRLFRYLLLATVIFVLITVICYEVIRRSAQSRLYANLDHLPENKVGLILGTSPYFRNQYFTNRIDAAVLLFNAGKIHSIIVSGDNHVEGYDEPTMMKKVLIARGIPDSCITLDYAGFRTLDSIIRCKEVFGQDAFTIISQEFHNERALYIARRYGIEAIAYNAGDVDKSYGFKTRMREYLARVLCVIDLYVLNTRPHFLGEKIPVK